MKIERLLMHNIDVKKNKVKILDESHHDLGFLPVEVNYQFKDGSLIERVKYKRTVLDIDNLTIELKEEKEEFGNEISEPCVHSCMNCKYGLASLSTNLNCKLQKEYNNECQKHGYNPYAETREGEGNYPGYKITREIQYSIYKKYNMKDENNCETYKSHFIEYPIEANEVQSKNYRELYKNLKLVKVFDCSDKKTYLGILLDESGPVAVAGTFSPDEKKFKLYFTGNPMIYVPLTQKFIYGCESYWGKIKSKEEFKEISKEEIDNLWYVKMAKKC